MGAVVAVTVMHVLLFVLQVCLLGDCWGARVTAMLVWGPGEVWYVFVVGRGGRCYGEWVTGMGLGFTNSGGTWGKWNMGMCFGCGGVGGVGESGWAS